MGRFSLPHLARRTRRRMMVWHWRAGSAQRLMAGMLSVLALALFAGWLQEPARPAAAAIPHGQAVPLPLQSGQVALLSLELEKAGKMLDAGDDGLVVMDRPKGVAVRGLASVDADELRSVLPPLPARAPGERPMIAVVIDDLGPARERAREAIALPLPVTLAFLPYADGVGALAAVAKARGHELIVHMPMEPGAGGANPGPDALLTSLDQTELVRRLNANLARFEGFAGINNHMGSRFTQSSDGMALVTAELARRGLFFLDSRTTTASAARQAAVDSDLRYAERDVFLDNHRDAPYLALQLHRVELLARRNGSAIAIGHPHGVTLEALASWLVTLEQRGFDVVPVSAVISRRQTPLWRLALEARQRRSG